MADTLTTQSSTLATVPASSIIATDDAGAAGHVQVVKLALSTDGSATPITADANGLEVQGAGTAGTPAGGVVSVQGVASGTVIPVSDGGSSLTVDGTVAVSGTVTVDGSGATQPVSHAGLTELAAAINASSQMDVNIAASGATVPISHAALTELAAAIDTEVQVDIVSSALPSGAATSAKQDTAQTALDAIKTAVELLDNTVGGTELQVDIVSAPTLTVNAHAVTNAGTFAVQVDGNALTALQLIDDTVFTDDAAFTPGTSKVSIAGFQADEASIDSVDEGDAGAARMTLDRKVITQPQPHTAGGLSIFRSLDLDETEEDVKTSAGQVYAVWFSNMATTTRFLKFYNATAANVTVGTTTPVLTLALPGNSSDDISGVFSSTMGIAFDTAITVAATTGLADNDTGAPAANDVICNVFYK